MADWVCCAVRRKGGTSGRCHGEHYPNTTLQNFTPTLPSIIVGITLKGWTIIKQSKSCMVTDWDQCKLQTLAPLTFIGCPAARNFRLKLLGCLRQPLSWKIVGSCEIPIVLNVVQSKIVLNTFLLGAHSQCLQHNQTQHATLWTEE